MPPPAVYGEPTRAGGDEQAQCGGERGGQPAARAVLPVGSGGFFGEFTIGVVAAGGEEVPFHVGQLGVPVVSLAGPVQCAGQPGTPVQVGVRPAGGAPLCRGRCQVAAQRSALFVFDEPAGQPSMSKPSSATTNVRGSSSSPRSRPASQPASDAGASTATAATKTIPSRNSAGPT
jgi:hypothetical protein